MRLTPRTIGDGGIVSRSAHSIRVANDSLNTLNNIDAALGEGREQKTQAAVGRLFSLMDKEQTSNPDGEFPRSVLFARQTPEYQAQLDPSMRPNGMYSPPVRTDIFERHPRTHSHDAYREAYIGQNDYEAMEWEHKNLGTTRWPTDYDDESATIRSPADRFEPEENVEDRTYRLYVDPKTERDS